MTSSHAFWKGRLKTPSKPSKPETPSRIQKSWCGIAQIGDEKTATGPGRDAIAIQQHRWATHPN